MTRRYNSQLRTLIFRKVNKNWEAKKIKQRCKEDIVHIGNNWADFLWPSSVILESEPDKFRTDKVPLLQANGISLLHVHAS